ncbi:MAG: DUF885 domain-containing protein [Phycisphaerae bacterium]|nr:DUF885 domain-containing protein [Phycisphaerae bacterium]
MHTAVLVAMLMFAPPPALSAPGAPAATADTSAASDLEDFFREYDAWRFYDAPEYARERGHAIGLDRISQQGIAPESSRHGQRQLFLDDLGAIAPTTLNERDRLDYDLFKLELEQAIESFERNEWLECVGPLHGPQQQVPQLARKLRFEREDDYVNYLRQLTWVPQNLRNTVAMLQLGVERGRVPPKVVLAGLPQQFESVLRSGLDALGDPFRTFPASIPAARQAQLATEFREAALPPIRAAFEEVARYITTEYIPACRDSIAAGDGPDGVAYYRFRLRAETTTALTPEEIHAIGVREVARIRAEMLTVIRRTDWFTGDVQRGAEHEENELFRQFLAFLRSDRRFYFDNADELLSRYRDICKRVDAHLPALFGRMPRLPYGVRPIPAFMAPTQTTGYYEHGSIANGVPGWFAVNTYALDQRPTYEMIPLALHEAVPGHHLQIALAQELDGLREFRRNVSATAFVEGWALYAERLGIEMQLYDDPYDDFGRLLYEMWRSCRLVVDTGMHALQWSREQAIAFMMENTALSELNIRNEIDRYISWPGQACAYKIGEIMIRELREAAELALGERFSLRSFHDVVLEAGPIPLTVLDARVRRWIETQKTLAAPAQ